ncbi:MAG TPA: serine protease [Terracidiphilus sp.]|nr:serine protease [Terracidiphilus sp.]
MRVRSLAFRSGLAVLALSTLAAIAQPHTATKPVHSAPNLTPDALFKKDSPSVFIVEAVDSHGEVLFQQSGVAISPHAIASTKTILGTFANLSPSNHKAVARYRLRQGYRTWSVERVFVDSQRDISTFESADLDAQPPQTVKFTAITVGERIYAVSFPKEQEETLTEGTVSGLDSADGAMPIHTTISLAAESAGGGVFDANGKLLGLIAFTAQASLNSVIPVGWLQRPRILYSGIQSQGKQSDTTEEVITRATVVSSNIQTFASAAMLHQDKIYQENSECSAVMNKIAEAVVVGLIDKDAPESFDNWPVWRQAVAEMEELRTEFNSVSESGAMEGSESHMQEISSRNVRDFVNAGKKEWSEALDVYCKEVPGGPYTDLDGKERACAPAH